MAQGAFQPGSGAGAATAPAAALRDIHLPDPVSWWPPAPAWWVVVALAIVAVAWLVRRFRRRRQLRFAQAELARALVQWRGDQDGHRFAASISVLLRRLALSRFDKQTVAGLTGTRWLEFLAAHSRGEVADGFRRGVGRCLIEAPYDPGARVDPVALAALGRAFIRGLPSNDAGRR